MAQKETFISSYIKYISNRFGINEDKSFQIFSISVILNRPYDEVYSNVITDGNYDCGFDGIYFEIDEDSQRATIYVFQCKNAKGLKEKELEKYQDDFEKIFSRNNSTKRTLNDKIKNKLDEFIDLINKRFIVTPKLYFIFNGDVNDAENSNNKELYKRYNNPSLNYFIVDNNELYDKISLYREEKRNDVIFTFSVDKSNISPVDPQAIISCVVLNITSLYFRLSAYQLCELIEEEIKQNKQREFLYSKNIRGYLGKKRKPNKMMQDTILDPNNSYYFQFYNNGITMICDDFEIPTLAVNKYNIRIKNPIIVNGLQTAETIYEFYNDPKKRNLLGSVFIFIKICKINDDVIINKITEATNTQTAITIADQLSNAPFNIFAKELFNNNNIGYILKRGEIFSNKNENFPEIVEHDTILKYWYATYYEEPATAKRSISKVLEIIFDAEKENNEYLKDLFNKGKDSPVLPQLLNVYKIYKMVIEKRLEYKNTGKDAEDFIYASDELLAYGIYKYIDNKNLNFEYNNLLAGYNTAYSIIKQMVEEEKEISKRKNRTYSHNNYFKIEESLNDYKNNAGIKNKNIEELIKELKNKK